MTYRRVNLGKEVPVGVLEKILLDAALEIGWKASSKDKYRTEYRLGSLHREERYFSTDVQLRGSFLPLGEVSFNKDSQTKQEFSIFYGLGFGVATRAEIEKYLLAVSKRIEALKTPGTSPKVLAGTV